MEIEPKNLDIPLQKRSWFPQQIAVGAFVVAWLWHRPIELAQIVVSCVIGGSGVWFFLASPIMLKLGTHEVLLVRGLAMLAAVGGLVLFMSEVVPHVHKLVA